MPAVAPNISEISEQQQQLRTANYELEYEKSCRTFEGVTKDEEIRKLRVRIHVIEDEIEELNAQLAEEEERSDGLAEDLQEIGAKLDEVDEDNQHLSNEIRIKSRELNHAKTELLAMNDVSNDTAKVLRDKLALARELSNLKPELEHLRSQAACYQEVLSEKLSLQRQLSTVEVELENAKRSMKRTAVEVRTSSEKDAEMSSLVEELKQQLKETKKALEESKTENKALRCNVEAAEKSSEHAATKREAEDKTSVILKTQIEQLRKELAAGQKDYQRVSNALEKEQAVWEAHKSSLVDKNASFRTKLRSTKEKLKEVEAALQQAQEASVSRQSQYEKPSKNPRKRHIAQLDPDAAIGTPGDTAPAKRGKRSVSAQPGDKSTFSITPFLNRTMSLAPESPVRANEDLEKGTAPEVDAEAEVETTPSAAPQKSTKQAAAPKLKSKPLAPASSAKQNRKPAAPSRTKSAVSGLQMVPEEEENLASQKTTKQSTTEEATTIPYQESTTTTTIPALLVPKLKPSSMKPRKSLMSFASFVEEPAAEKKKKKTRKLGGGASSSSFLGGKTLFDDDDEDKPAAKPIPGRGFMGGRALGKSSLFTGKKTLLGPIIRAEEVSTFSPLKKERKAAALAQSLLGD